MWPIVTDQVMWSVGLSVTGLSPAKMAEPIDIPFGYGGLGLVQGIVLAGGPDPPWEVAILRGERWYIVKSRDALQ